MDAAVEQESVNAALALDHLSWSGIQTYKQCPRKFHFRYIAKAPEEQTAAALIYGSAIHQAIECIHEARLAGSGIPKLTTLLTKFQEAWNEAIAMKAKGTYAKNEDAGTVELLGFAARVEPEPDLGLDRRGGRQVIGYDLPRIALDQLGGVGVRRID